MSFISLNSYSNPININGGGNTGDVTLSGNNVFTGLNTFTQELSVENNIIATTDGSSINGFENISLAGNSFSASNSNDELICTLPATFNRVNIAENGIVVESGDITITEGALNLNGDGITFSDLSVQTTAFTPDTYVLLTSNNVISGNNEFSGENQFANVINCSDITSDTLGSIQGFSSIILDGNNFVVNNTDYLLSCTLPSTFTQNVNINSSLTFSDLSVQTTAYLGAQNSWVGYVSINQNSQPFTTIATAKNDPQIVNFNVPTPTGLQAGTYIIDWGFYITYTNSVTGNSDFSLFCTNVWLASNIQIPSANFYNTYFCQFRQEIDILSPVDSTIPIGLSIFDLTTGAGYSINYMVATIITKAT